MCVCSEMSVFAFVTFNFLLAAIYLMTTTNSAIVSGAAKRYLLETAIPDRNIPISSCSRVQSGITKTARNLRAVQRQSAKSLVGDVEQTSSLQRNSVPSSSNEGG